MKYILKFVFLGVLVLIFFGCAPKLSPGISYHNLSPESIVNITCTWNGSWVKSVPELWPGQGASTNIWIKKRSDYFGEVVLKWQNAVGRNFVEKINVTEKDFPLLQRDFKDVYGFSIFFTQEGIDYYVEMMGEPTEEDYRRAALRKKYRSEYIKRKVEGKSQ